MNKIKISKTLKLTEKMAAERQKNHPVYKKTRYSKKNQPVSLGLYFKMRFPKTKITIFRSVYKLYIDYKIRLLVDKILRWSLYKYGSLSLAKTILF